MAAAGALPSSGQAREAAAWVLPVAEVKAAFEALKPGGRLVYGRGPQLIRGETSVYVRGLYEKGLADLAQPRSEAGFDFIVQRRSPIPARRSKRIGCDHDQATRTILAALMRAAERGRVCPSDMELARIAGLATKAQAQGRVAKLRDLGTIRSAAVTGDRAIARVVTIVGNGKHTKAPEGWRPSPGSGRGQ